MTAAPTQDQDWTNGPAKWAAVIVLGSASIAGMAWSIFFRQPAPLTAPTRTAPQPIAVSTAPPLPPPDAAPQPQPTPQAQTQPQPAPAPPPAPSTPRPARINVNTATAAELELLPGIGPVTAARIIDHRTKNGPFKSIAALDAVKGIGPKTIESLRPLVTVE